MSTIIVDSISFAQVKAARALLNITQTDLAKAASLGLSTVVDFERERREVSESAIKNIRQALERAGIEFLSETRTTGAGVRLRKKVK